MTGRIRVGIDLRSGPGTWLGGLYYLRNLILAIRTLPEAELPDLVGLLPMDNPNVRAADFEPLLPLLRFRAGNPGGQLEAKVLNRLRHVVNRGAAPFGVSRAARQGAVDVLFPTLKTRVPRGVAHLPWAYDLQHVERPEHFSGSELSFRNRAFRAAARHAPLVVVSSAVAASAFASRYPKATGKLRVLRFTTVLDDRCFDADQRQVAARYDLRRTFILFPGQFWVHKDHETAFEAVRLLRETDPDFTLVCTGDPTDYRFPAHYAKLKDIVRRHALEKQVRILGVVPRDDYVQLLRAARAVLQPSRYEGWSSVVEDARALGKRIVLSDLPVHLEQAPEGAVYFPAGEAGQLASRLHETFAEVGNPLSEDEARDNQRERIQAYGRKFVAIVREAAESRY
jgi:glycosyltransferase involved in cell wall biosynthesis